MSTNDHDMEGIERDDLPLCSAAMMVDEKQRDGGGR
jgi:hypothetical protein